MTRCSYASCALLARVELDGWPFCSDHAGDHKDEAVGAHQPTTKPRTADDPRCGTIPGWRFHVELDEEPCGACRTAKYRSDKDKLNRTQLAALRREQRSKKAAA